MEQLFAEYETLHDIDVSYDSDLPNRAKNSLMNMGFKLCDIFGICMEEWYFYDFMLMKWLKNNDFEYRVITEFDLDKDKADKYKTINRWGNKDIC